ncbi:MAG: hypothetical protein IPH88_16655 [Bacteroidales bacterium]|nr:hypothetical protein [Bacteroidales bacterium]
MAFDFTIRQYEQLLDALQGAGYKFQTFSEFLEAPLEKVVILRHDVDARNTHSLAFAKIQAGRKIKGSYYFRMVQGSYDERIIREMESMGHEIGYHYETMDTAKGDVDRAYQEFCNHLETLRKIASIRTICMHGSPRSPFDNKDTWKKYSYRELGIIGEPYFDVDFNEVGYLTDTGRRWNGDKVSVRDKVQGKYQFDFRSTNEIIQNIGKLPSKMMFTFHPQRWTDKPIIWTQELLMQGLKNQIKRVLLSRNG